MYCGRILKSITGIVFLKSLGVFSNDYFSYMILDQISVKSVVLEEIGESRSQGMYTFYILALGQNCIAKSLHA
jgi:hypothetical protein